VIDATRKKKKYRTIASGPDNIHGRILKECTTQIAPILTTLFSLSLKTGKIPEDWNILLYSRCFMILLVTTCSKSLQMIHVSEIGL
jgi:hypothetical protein